MSSRIVLFVLTSHAIKGNTGKPTGWYLSEAAHPWKVLHDKGVQVEFLSPGGGAPPVDGFDLKDPINKEFWENEAVQAGLKQTLTPDKVDIQRYAAIHFVGGHGAMWDFPDNAAIARITAGIYENQGVVSAVCHGPSGLVNVRLADGTYLVQGKKVAAFTNAEEAAAGMREVVPFLLADKLKERGAHPLAAANWTDNVQVDGRLVTGQNPQSAESLGWKLAEMIGV